MLPAQLLPPPQKKWSGLGRSDSAEPPDFSFQRGTFTPVARMKELLVILNSIITCDYQARKLSSVVVAVGADGDTGWPGPYALFGNVSA